MPRDGRFAFCERYYVPSQCVFQIYFDTLDHTEKEVVVQGLEDLAVVSEEDHDQEIDLGVRQETETETEIETGVDPDRVTEEGTRRVRETQKGQLTMLYFDMRYGYCYIWWCLIF